MCHLEKGRGVTSGVTGIFAPSRGNQDVFRSTAQTIDGQCINGGRGGIRTHGTVTRTSDFESDAFNHSATLPLKYKGLTTMQKLVCCINLQFNLHLICDNQLSNHMKNTTPENVAFTKVIDKSGNPVRGLWVRPGIEGDVYYAQLRITNPTTGRRIPHRLTLGKEVKTLPQARQAMAVLKEKERKGELNGSSSAPKFGDYVKYYLSHAAKHELSLNNEKSFLARWEAYFGSDLRIDKINEVSIRDFLHKEAETISDKTKTKLSNHSLNLRLYALRAMLKMAMEEKHITHYPFDGIHKLKHVPEKKEIPNKEQIESFIAMALTKCKSGKQFADYIHLLMYTGARENEALSLEWSDIDFDKKLVHLHRETKFNKERYVNFNPKLEALLERMDDEKTTKFLFPSKRANLKAGRMTTFRFTIERVRKLTGIYLSEHYLRHYFTTMCYMAGVDMLTLSQWLGHVDTSLIAKVYSHLNNTHKAEQASKLTTL